MNWSNFNTYGESPQQAFETLCNQLFERYLRRNYPSDLTKFRVVNGAGGDGGIEAYGELRAGNIIAVQSKYFRDGLHEKQIGQIKSSITTALALRPNITEYIVCIPRDHNSLKFGRGAKGAAKQPITNSEELRIDNLTDEIEATYPNLKITWWFEFNLMTEIQEPDNEGVLKFWFERELLSMNHLIQQFDLQKRGWIDKRYIPQLHGAGEIQEVIQCMLYTSLEREKLVRECESEINKIRAVKKIIELFLPTFSSGTSLYAVLSQLLVKIDANLDGLRALSKLISEGITDFSSITLVPFEVDSRTLFEIESHIPNNLQVGLPERLAASIRDLNVFDKLDLIRDYTRVANLKGHLFVGDAGTGKTHALANTVDIRLHDANAPALIVPAKGTPCGDWTQILTHALDLNGWKVSEILSALETLAIRRQNAWARSLSNLGEEVKREPIRVIVCIDGLEEDTQNWDTWYSRIRESMEWMKRYSHILFVFTARTYFLRESELPTEPTFGWSEIPSEGDVPVSSVMDQYFSPAHFNISISSKSLVRGIDTLFALRLFCELYEGKTLTSEDDILTAEIDLLNEKADRMEADFRKQLDAGIANFPIRESLSIVSDLFFEAAEIDHSSLLKSIENKLSYLDKSQINKLIDFLVNHGILVRFEAQVNAGILKQIKVIYRLTYQSVMELIMSDKYVTELQSGAISELPGFLVEQDRNGNLMHERILVGITNTLAHKHGRMIGDDGFLISNMPEGIIPELRVRAMLQAPSTDDRYKAEVKTLFYSNLKSKNFVFRRLIFPAAAIAGHFLGAEFLHEMLMDEKTAFDRDQIWMGNDHYGVPDKVSDINDNYDLKRVIDPYPDRVLLLPDDAKHNEHPLVFAWALSTLDQAFRERLRIALTNWALEQPGEYKLLLDKIFHCNDLQIREDLASITLGVASKIKDEEAVANLAHWSLNNVFNNPTANRNVVVRAGFKAIVDRGCQIGVISKEEAKSTLPKKLTDTELLPLDEGALRANQEEYYPIVHDLAWYVMKRSYDDFLELNNGATRSAKSKFGNEFLAAYQQPNLNAYNWAQAAAIAYMKSLGFSRTEGNWMTGASHGSKSKLFTSEEKYTWLAVHFLKGFLSDHLPLLADGKFITDYFKIIHVPNPAEFFTSVRDSFFAENEPNWSIKESLVHELETDGIEHPDDLIKLAIEKEPLIDFNHWLLFKESEIRTTENEDEWLAIFNYTNLHDSRDYISGYLEARALLIEKGQVPVLLESFKDQEDRNYDLKYLDGLQALPDTDSYTNPSDVVWMSDIGEIEHTGHYYPTSGGEKKSILYTLTKVLSDSVDGELETMIPSKIIRQALGITEMDGNCYLNPADRVMAVGYKLSEGDYNRQEVVLVRKEELLKAIHQNDLELVWLVVVHKSKNPHNPEIRTEIHPMKTRKYFVWFDDGHLRWEKVWDARFSDRRDETGDDDDNVDEKFATF